jgi:hypothetical protein
MWRGLLMALKKIASRSFSPGDDKHKDGETREIK